MSTDRSGLFIVARPADAPGQRTTDLRRFAFTFLATAGLLSATFLAANVALDPDALFGTGRFTPLIPDFRALKLRLYDDLPAAPDALILGSSTAGALRPSDMSDLAGGNAFNFAILGGSIEDVLASLRYAHEQGAQPSTVVVGLDLDALDERAPTRDDERVFSETQALLGEPASAFEKGRAWLGTYRPHYAFADAKVLYYTLRGYPEPIRSFDPDGLLHYTQIEREIAAGTYDYDELLANDAATQDLARSYHEAFASLERPGAAKIDVVRSIVNEARAEGARVHLVVMPLHPRAEDDLASTGFPAFHAATLDALRPLCAEGVRLVDATHTADWGGNTAHFTDPRHPLATNSRPLLDHALHGPDLCST